ncbi:MAG: IS110 family transposase [Bacteroidota bacterium]
MVHKHTILDWLGQHVFVGLDVHKRSWIVAIVTELTVFKTFTQPPDVKLLVSYLHRHFPNATYHCVYEAGYCGFWIHDQLRAHGIDCMVINPADVPTTDKQKKHKTNKVDARKLARSLRNGELTALYVPTRAALEARSLVRSRHLFVSKQTRCKNQIKALLSFYGITVPEDIVDRYWSARYLTWLRSLSFQSPSGTHTLKTLLDELAHLRTSILDITRAIRTLARTEPYAENIAHLITIAGISTLVAMILLTEIITLDRFRSLDHLACFVGLVPGERSSGDDRTLTGMTERKNRYLRWILTEAAWVAIRNDECLALDFNTLSRRMPKNQAIVRIARKLLNRVRFVLKHQQPCVVLKAA